MIGISLQKWGRHTDSGNGPGKGWNLKMKVVINIKYMAYLQFKMHDWKGYAAHMFEKCNNLKSDTFKKTFTQINN